METYIVRIYRREEEENEEKTIVGTVELVGSKTQTTFDSAEGLWDFIVSVKKRE